MLSLHSIQNLIYKPTLQNEMIINILVVSSGNLKWSPRAVNQGRLPNKQDFYKIPLYLLAKMVSAN